MSFPFAFFPAMPGPFELLIIAMIALLLFGNRLPGVMGSLGRSVVEFKKGLSGVENEVGKVTREVEDAVNKSDQSTNK